MVADPALVETSETFIELLERRAQLQPEHEAFTFLHDGETVEASWTYRELDVRVRAIAADLQTRAPSGSRVLLFLPPGLDYLAAFYGVLTAGLVAVPLQPPRIDHGAGGLEGIVAATQPSIALVTAETYVALALLVAESPALQSITWIVLGDLGRGGTEWKRPDIDRNALACLILTSGSTGVSKGVALTHGGLLASLALFVDEMHIGPESRWVGWIPFQASMGVLTSILLPVYGGFPATLLSAAAFLERPVRWLAAISNFGATHSAASNFAYDLCARAISEEERQALDLKGWLFAGNGGEAIRSETLDRFAGTFAACGFRRDALTSIYGLSETMMVSLGPFHRGPLVRHLDARSLEYGEVVTSNGDDNLSRRLVGCGMPFAGTELVIVDPEQRERSEAGRVGEIWTRGPNVGQGYWNRPEETAESFGAVLADGSLLPHR
jgi:acyl-CoA synthetase (AMP-forming)/AMP-acid ligase II